jgi:hypothetical protein
MLKVILGNKDIDKYITKETKFVDYNDGMLMKNTQKIGTEMNL